MTPTATTLPVPEDSSILGAHIRDGGALFALWTPRATRVELALVAEDRSQHSYDMSRAPDGVWTVFVPGVGAEQRYGYRVHGPWDPPWGLQPGQALARPVRPRDHGWGRLLGPDSGSRTCVELHSRSDRLDFAAVPLSVVVPESPRPHRSRDPHHRRQRDLRAARKGYTQLHPRSRNISAAPTPASPIRRSSPT